MDKYKIVSLKENPDLKECLAEWFHKKWGIPLSAYLESMEECLNSQNLFRNGIR